MTDVYTASLVLPDTPFVDSTGALTQFGHRLVMALWYRTGQGVGVNAAAVQTQVISNTTTIAALAPAVTTLTDLSVWDADPIDPPPDILSPWLIDTPADPPDMGAAALLALAL